MESAIFNEWFLSTLLNYLNMKDIVAMDTAICNKVARDIWLECIAKDISAVSTKIQPYLIDDRPIEWCYKKNIQFKCLNVDFKKRLKITHHGVSLLTMCCENITEFQLSADVQKADDATIFQIKDILIQLGQKCKNLKEFAINSRHVTDSDIAFIISNNHNLEAIKLEHCKVTDMTLRAVTESYSSLLKISLWDIDDITDQGISTLISNYHDLEDIQIVRCVLLTDECLIAIAENCHKLVKIALSLELITDEGFVALVSSNRGLQYISITNCYLLTDASLIAIADFCSKLRKIFFQCMHDFTDQGLSALVSNNHDLEDIELCECQDLTDASLIAIAKNCHKLKRICFWFMMFLTDQGIAVLVSKIHNYIQDIEFNACTSLTAKSLTVIVQTCHKLKRFYINNAENDITDKEIVSLVTANRDLEEIAIHDCNLLTEASAMAIVNNCYKLKKLTYLLTHKSTQSAIKYLIKKFPGTEIITHGMPYS